MTTTIKINQSVTIAKTSFQAINEQAKAIAKNRLTAKQTFTKAVITDFEDNRIYIEDEFLALFVTDYFTELELTLALDEEEVTLNAIIEALKTVLAKNYFTLEFGYLSVMSKIIDKLDFIKSANQLKSLKKANDEAEYKKLLNGVLKDILNREKFRTIRANREIFINFRKREKSELIQIAKIANLLSK